MILFTRPASVWGEGGSYRVDEDLADWTDFGYRALHRIAYDGGKSEVCDQHAWREDDIDLGILDLEILSGPPHGLLEDLHHVLEIFSVLMFCRHYLLQSLFVFSLFGGVTFFGQ